MELNCPFCVSVFDKELGLKACSGCPLAPGCGKVKCPYCGEEFYPPSNISQIFSKRRRTKADDKASR